MKPFNLFFTVVYYLGRALLSVLFPATVEGLDRLPRNGVLLCPNHSSNWDPILIALRLPVNYRPRWIFSKIRFSPGSCGGWALSPSAGEALISSPSRLLCRPSDPATTC